MKKFLVASLFISLLAPAVFGQGAQADMVKRRAKELSNQNNVRQGVPPPAQAQPPAAVPARPAGTNAVPQVTQAQSLAKLKTDLAGFKLGDVASAEQKQQFTVDLARAARGTKPSLATVKKFVDSLTAALATATLAPEQQDRLAQDLDGVFNAKSLSMTQFDQTIADVQAILEVGAVKRATAVSVAADLKAVGTEVRH